MSIFQFKKFTLKQSDSAAKLTTDATIFGAWLPLETGMKSALEIGTGTGILSLMLAQRSDLNLLALEIEESAYNEATQNFESSPWSNQLEVIHQDFTQYISNERFDLIFSNPPFFTNNLQSSINSGKNMAYHTDKLSFANLANGINRYLKATGKAYIMLPQYEMGLFSTLMQQRGFYIQSSLSIHHNSNKSALRVIQCFSRDQNPQVKVEKIYIREENNDFHPEYMKLLKPFLTIF